VTASIGIAPLPFEGMEISWEQAVTHADRALYEAKREGRNRWVDARRIAATAAGVPQAINSEASRA